MSKQNTEKMSLRIEAIWQGAEERILQDIVRRIKQYGKITSTADYQINRLVEMGKSTEEIERLLKDALDATYPEMYKLYDDVANWQYVRNKDIYEQINREFIPPEDNEELKQISSSIKSQTTDVLKNLAQSYGFTIPIGGRQVFTPFAEYWQKYVDEGIMDVASGAFDYNTVIRRIVSQMTNSGLRTVDYASGRSFRVSVAARNAVLTGVAQITGKIAEQNASKLGTDHFEVDWHAGARPEHREWQGKVYSYQQLIDICGLGTVTGLHGANCYHDYYPFVLGVSERLYTDEWLEEQNRKEEETKIWNGKEYNLYEQTQKQRQMETAMRAQREKVQLLKEAGVDEEEIMLARAKYQAQLGEYAQFCKKMDLQQQRERIYYDMRGRVAPNIKDYAKFMRERKLSSNAVKSVARAGNDDIIKIDAKPGTSKYRKQRRKAIVEKGVSLNKPIFTDDAFGKLASNLSKKDGFYDVIMHGAPKTVSFFGQRTDAKTIAEILKKRQDYDNIPVRLLSCSTGKGTDCFAQRLANELGVLVEAPDDIIWARSDGTYTIGPNKYKNIGSMKCFYPERK